MEDRVSDDIMMMKTELLKQLKVNNTRTSKWAVESK